MARSYPTAPRSAFLEWCRVHEPLFTTHAAEIGLSAEAVLAFKEAADLGGDRLLEQQAVQEKAKVATQQVVTAFDSLGGVTGNLVRTIRAFAERSANPDAVYALAQIAPPARSSPLPPPGQPTRLTVRLDPTEGTLTLRWKGDNPAGGGGTTYLVRRRLPGESGFSFIGVSGKKTFVDATLIAGPDSVEYTVQGQRADLAGPASPIFTVNFGKLPNGGRSASVTANADGALANMAGATANTAGVTANGGHTAAQPRWKVEIPTPSGNGHGVAARR